MAAVAVPILIHLWNVRQGKTLKVGSVLFITGSAAQQARSLRFTDILLLALRCLLIIILAFLVAGPVWKTRLTTSGEKGWVMLEKQSLNEAYKRFGPAIDSLLKAGYRFHYLAKGFEPDKFEEAIKKAVDTTTESNVSYWALLKELNEQVPPDLPVYLFTGNRLNRFAGSRPEVGMNLKWFTYTQKDTVGNFLVKADKTAEDSIRIITADSKPTLGFYRTASIPLTGNVQYKVSKRNGRRLVSSAGSNVELDTSVVNVVIYTDGFSADAAYVKAALDAIHQYTKLPMKISVVSNAADVKPGTGWLFWLSEKELPPLLPSRVFLYQKGKEQETDSWITGAGAVPVNGEVIHLSRLIQDTAVHKYETVWRDGYGHTVLSLKKEKNAVYRFYSRFDPEWNDLVWSSQFAEMIYRLLEEDRVLKKTDRRMIDAAQVQPVPVKNREAFDKQKFVETTDLGKLFWLLAFALFCAERIISFTRKNTAHA